MQHNINLQQGLPPDPDSLFVLKQKVSKKFNPSADGRFARKTCAQLAETVQTRSFVAQTGQFLTPTSLVFRLTERGQFSVNANIVRLIEYLKFL